MGNHLNIRRQQVQDITPEGEPDGDPYYVVHGSDNVESHTSDHYDSLAELNAAIEAKPSIMAFLKDTADAYEAFATLADPTSHDNYCGTVCDLEPDPGPSEPAGPDLDAAT